MKIEALQIIEFRNKTDGTQISESTQALIKTVQAVFRPETCSRQVMIFFHIANQQEFTRLSADIKPNVKHFYHLKGYEAYKFLLSWAIGAEYREVKKGYKLPLFNDNHVLGKIRDNWNKFKSICPKEYLLDLEKLITMLLEDAHQIRRGIEEKRYGIDQALRLNIDSAIKHVIFSRMNSLPICHETLHKPHQEYLLSIARVATDSSRQLLKKYADKQDTSPALEHTVKKHLFHRVVFTMWQSRYANLLADQTEQRAPSPTLNRTKDA